MTALAAPPLTPKSTATRKRLLDLAARMFIESGYAAISLRDIADEAGLTKGAIYGHFRSKGQLLVEVIRSELAQRDNMLDLGEAASIPTNCSISSSVPGAVNSACCRPTRQPPPVTTRMWQQALRRSSRSAPSGSSKRSRHTRTPTRSCS